MIKRVLALSAFTAGLFVSFALPQQAVAQPAATKAMQDAQRKAEQKVRETKKKDRDQARAPAQKQESDKSASAP
ncbi:hypothetical protein J8I87_42110 [Paraburkholderia sp. LEh10]|uniref:hypothetical protein n=1 Tax=Paraburkholderia sp. LEh10 TaxID=2821353 RepID=UPI001AE56016|nr:hypothetical protein [Paraburkholderia sp. LEh10]MBP0596093.1 hypothetical protein [Paraburkholderia sp. LEh10]